MKSPAKILALACIALVVALWSAYSSPAQEPMPPPAAEVDLGEANLLVLACAYAMDKAVDEGLIVRYCRRQAPEEVSGYKAEVHAKVVIEGYGPFLVDVEFRKSLWWVQDWDVKEAP